MAVLDPDEQPQAQEADHDHDGGERQEDPQEPPAEAATVREQDETVVEHREDGSMTAVSLAPTAMSQETSAGASHRESPRDDPRAVAEQGHEQEGRAEKVRARGDVADRLGHQRMDGEQRRGRERDGELARAVDRQVARRVVVRRRAPREREQQPDVQQVQQQVRDVVAERREAPHGVVHRVGEIDERALDVVQDDGPEVPQVRDRRVLHDDEVVVVDERVRQRVPVREDREQEREGAEARGEQSRLLGLIVSHLYRLV